MPVTEPEHLLRAKQQREYRDTSPAPEDERLALPGPVRFASRPRGIYAAECPRCGREATSTTMEITCECGCVLVVSWP